jgi:uncharacterized protein (DUF305 family)
MKAAFIPLFALTALIAVPVIAQQSADQDYKAAMERMQQDMMRGMDPDATKAWVKMMIPHHQGALDMSKAVLKVTTDGDIKKMAQKTIDAQTKDIKELQAWLSKHGG